MWIRRGCEGCWFWVNPVLDSESLKLGLVCVGCISWWLRIKIRVRQGSKWESCWCLDLLELRQPSLIHIDKGAHGVWVRAGILGVGLSRSGKLEGEHDEEAGFD
ncbi:hypothetical protein Droror1_Dr00018740 [Drosera rotundifolia]